jgi:predicted ribonuclease YlaK
MHSIVGSWEVPPPMYQREVFSGKAFPSRKHLPHSLNGNIMAKAKENKKINHVDLVAIKPLGNNQKQVFDTWKKNKHQFLFGPAGTGKTFISLYLALQDVFNLKKPQEKVILVRSLMPTRDIGFLPGESDLGEAKELLYQVPYQNMVTFMFKMQNEQQFNSLYYELKEQDSLFFISTSFLRGLTLDNAIIIVDECQNLNFHELDTIITRVGQDSRIIFCGDFSQSDLVKTHEINGLHDFLKILGEMGEFNCLEFTIGDIVRSGFVRSYLINKTKLGMGIE